MFKIEGLASSRETTIGGMIETFIDNNTNLFSIEQLEMLEGLSVEVDNAASLLQKEIDGLNVEYDSVKGEIEALQDYRDELETQVQDLQTELEELK